MRTMLFCHLLIDLICTLVLFLLWLQNRDRFHGIYRWFLQSVMLSVSLVLLALRGIVADWASILLANALIFAGSFACLAGIEEFFGNRRRWIGHWIFLVVSIAIHAWFTHVEPSLPFRALNSSVAMLWFTAHCALFLFRRVKPRLRHLVRFAGGIFLAYVGVNLLRIVLLLAGIIGARDFYSSGMEKGTILAFLALYVMFTYAVVLMVNRRLHAEIDDYRADLERMVETRTLQLVRSEKLASIGVLVAGVAHEINNPNNYIMLNGEILGKGWGEVMKVLAQLPPEARGQVGQLPLDEFAEEAAARAAAVVSGAERIRRIVLDLKTYARPGQDALDCVVDLVEVVRSALGLLEPVFRRSTDRVAISLPDGALLVRGNFQKLEQVLVNLVQNACQALPDRRRGIDIVLAREDGQAVLTVRDEGRGIPPADLVRITDPFFTTHPGGEGFGLGLAISLRIVQDHGGELHFDSDGENGTTVRVVLPAGG